MLSFRKHNFRIRPIGADTNSGQQTNNKAYKWLAVVASMVMLTSFTIASAAPTSNPPTGNVAPNFSGVDVSTKSSQADPSFAKLRVSTDNTDSVILEDYTNSNIFARISTVNPLFASQQAINLVEVFLVNSISKSNQILLAGALGINVNAYDSLNLNSTNRVTVDANVIGLHAPQVEIGDFGRGYFKTNSVQLSDQTFYRSTPDGNTITNRFVPCPADANGAYTGFVMACAYKVTGNQNLIFNYSTITTQNSTGKMGCNYNLNMPQINNPSPTTTSNVYARQLCYYGL
ncbi:hypothetical protein KA036_02715 [Candidatus Gracilibacteria bacterium]|nr:hypothetical protein [Candidatus Gracilibacteria bacterium]